MGENIMSASATQRGHKKIVFVVPLYPPLATKVAEGATYIRQGGHHVGHRPTFQFIVVNTSYLVAYLLIIPHNKMLIQCIKGELNECFNTKRQRLQEMVGDTNVVSRSLVWQCTC